MKIENVINITEFIFFIAFNIASFIGGLAFNIPIIYIVGNMLIILQALNRKVLR